MDNSDKTILCLYEVSGTFAGLFHAAGYNVIQVDIQNKPGKTERWEKRNDDVRLLTYMGGVNVYGIISHPPCDMFANSGAWARKLEKSKPATVEGFSSLYEQKMCNALSRVDCVLRMKYLYDPAFWFMENPTGTLINYIGNPDFRFQPNEFAGWLELPASEAFTKKTQLWGSFKNPERKAVEAVLGSIITNKYSSKQKNERSKTPAGFAKAFVTANI